MKKLNPKNLFSKFFSTEEEIVEESEELKGEIEFDDKFYFGMVITGVKNYEFLDVIYTNKYGEKYLNTSDTIKHRYFEMLFENLSKIEYKDLDAILDTAMFLGKDETKESLDIMLQYYVDLEEYEKCTSIKKLMDLVY